MGRDNEKKKPVLLENRSRRAFPKATQTELQFKDKRGGGHFATRLILRKSSSPKEIIGEEGGKITGGKKP